MYTCHIEGWLSETIYLLPSVNLHADAYKTYINTMYIISILHTVYAFVVLVKTYINVCVSHYTYERFVKRIRIFVYFS